jgi:hypothetical protein
MGECRGGCSGLGEEAGNKGCGRRKENEIELGFLFFFQNCPPPFLCVLKATICRQNIVWSPNFVPRLLLFCKFWFFFCIFWKRAISLILKMMHEK